jgi:hypothetical protein
MDDALREKFIALAAEDARVREALAADASLYDGYNPQMEAVHRANAEALEAALESGWPGVARVGPDGADAAWLIAQHAIGKPEFQRRCLAALEEAAARGDAPAWQAAYLCDRVRSMEGRGQLYGTQFDWDENGEMSPQPIEDEDNIDARRAAVGLPPLAEAIARQRAGVAESGEPVPKDHARRRGAFEAWLRKVGWRP